MGLLPIIGKALELFSFLIVSALTISYILYKIKSPKNRGNKNISVNVYQPDVILNPAFQTAYYTAAEAAPVVERPLILERVENLERRPSPVKAKYTERRQIEEKKARIQNRFEVLQPNEEGKIKAYKLNAERCKFN